MALPDRVTLKLAAACESRRGIASPTVALLILVSPDMVVVVQPAEPAVEQSKPVKPLVQTQEQMPLVTMLVPPFWHVSWFLHCWSAAACVFALAPCLRRTKNSTGMMTAAAIRMMMMIRIKMKPQSGSPQHRRPFLVGSGVEFSEESPLGPGPRGDPFDTLFGRPFNGGSGHERTDSRKLWRMLVRLC